MSDPGHPPFWRWFCNSMFVGVVTASVTVVFVCACAAYAFSRLRFKGRRAGLLSLLLVQMFPNLLAIVALFLFMTRIKGMFPAIGLGTSWGLIFIYLGGALGVNTWLMKGFFDTIPHELDESAKVDGCHPLPDLLQDHPPAGRAGARGDRAAVVHHHPGRVPRSPT